MISAMCSDWSISAGRLGTGPLGMIRKFSTPGSRIASQGSTSPASTFDRPTSFDSSKNWWMRGLRRSADTSTTRLPASASTSARLAAVVVLPSPAAGLVIMMVLMPLWAAANDTLVRRVR